MTRSTLHLLTPTWKPVGGVVKIMDYANHALAAGMDVSLWCPRRWEEDLPLFRIERFADLDPRREHVTVTRDERLSIGPRDLVFVSLPDNFEVAYRSLPRGMAPERIIHIIQNVRHVTPTWRAGYPLRLLTRPAARISTNDIVRDAVAPFVDDRGVHEVIPLGHDLGYFRKDRDGGIHRPVRVAHTAWKSDIGDRVADRVPDDRFTFRAIRDSVPWSDLRELYHWADVFLCAPNLEEGFYMPGLEAMEAGCLVVTPDVGGNMAYCRPDENCLLVGYEDVDDYVAALDEVTGWDDNRRAQVRDAGYASTAPFNLDDERTAFGSFLARLWDRIEVTESRGASTAADGRS